MSICFPWISVWHIAYNTCVYMHVCWRIEWATSLSVKCSIFFYKQYVKRRVDMSQKPCTQVTHFTPLRLCFFYIHNWIWCPIVFSSPEIHILAKLNISGLAVIHLSVPPSVNVLYLVTNFLELEVHAYNAWYC